jgi:hypothetical protein
MAGAAGDVIDAAQQDIGYAGKELSLQARLRGQALTVSQFSARLTDDQPPVKLVGEFPSAAGAGWSAGRRSDAGHLRISADCGMVDAELEWQHNRGQLLVTPRG